MLLTVPAEQLGLGAGSGCAGSVGPRGLPCAAGAAMLPGTATLPARRCIGRCTGGSASSFSGSGRAAAALLAPPQLLHMFWLGLLMMARRLLCLWVL
jgi:hypothetical protein